jgi:hypothetical protein
LKPWIGVDLDGTLAEYHGRGDGSIGKPIPKMVARVKAWLAEGKEVRIVTARAWAITRGVMCPPVRQHERQEFEAAVTQVVAIQAWCKEHLGQELGVTCAKDFGMIELWDDRAKQVIPNTGEALEELSKWLLMKTGG